MSTKKFHIYFMTVKDKTNPVTENCFYQFAGLFIKKLFEITK